MRKPNGYGSVVKLSGKRRKPYAFRITDGWELNKKGIMAPKYKYLEYFETVREASEYQAAFNSGHTVKEHIAINKTHTVAELYEIWSNKAYSKLGYGCISSYKTAFKKIEPMYSRRIDSIKIHEWQEILDKYSEKSMSTVNNIKIVIGNIYETAIKMEEITTNVTPHLDGEHIEKETSIHKEFSRDEIALIWKHTDDYNIRVILIMIYTGMRITELLILKTKNVNIDKKYMIGGIKTKAGKNRIIPISDKIMPFIKEIYDPESELFIGKKYNYNSFMDDIWNPAMETYHLDHLPHDTKHTCATLLDRAGVNENCRKMILGHQREGVTDLIYTHKDIVDLLDAINRI